MRVKDGLYSRIELSIGGWHGPMLNPMFSGTLSRGVQPLTKAPIDRRVASLCGEVQKTRAQSTAAPAMHVLITSGTLSGRTAAGITNVGNVVSSAGNLRTLFFLFTGCKER